MDEVEGIGFANIENWVNVFNGEALTYTVTTGLTATKQYRFRVRAVSEYEKLSYYSEVNTLYAAALPEQIQFAALSTDIFTQINLNRLTFTWE